jgi:hypothetical protein
MSLYHGDENSGTKIFETVINSIVGGKSCATMNLIHNFTINTYYTITLTSVQTCKLLASGSSFTHEQL